jgi:gentisate 1,2-dioxygenase
MAIYANQEQISGELELLHGELNDLRFVPGWNRPGNPPMWEAPASAFATHQWRYAEARQRLERAGDLVSPEFAERRNLILVNPTDGNRYPTSRTQVLAYQMIKPGERARTHRHAPHAGRLVLEADEGAYTVVDGVKLPMLPGDVLLTPGGMWHGHGHDGAAPAYWIDFLDVPLVHLLEPMFFEPYPGEWQAPTTETRQSPLLFPYEQTSALLDETAPDPTGCFGRRVDLGSPALPTIGLAMHRFDAGTRTRPYRTTANHQYCAVEGEGSTWVEGVEFRWSKGDVVVVPCWREHWHESAAGGTVLSVTDEPLQRYCGYLRTSVASTEGDSVIAGSGTASSLPRGRRD